jgi:hypothetical protein
MVRLTGRSVPRRWILSPNVAVYPVGKLVKGGRCFDERVEKLSGGFGMRDIGIGVVSVSVRFQYGARIARRL